jgi:hypothetical protein
MGLAEDLTEDKQQPWNVCGVAWALEQAGEQAPVILNALTNDGVSHRRISLAILKNLGLSVGENTIGRHRRGYCRCGQ